METFCITSVACTFEGGCKQWSLARAAVINNTYEWVYLLWVICGFRLGSFSSSSSCLFSGEWCNRFASTQLKIIFIPHSPYPFVQGFNQVENVFGNEIIIINKLEICSVINIIY